MHALRNLRPETSIIILIPAITSLFGLAILWTLYGQTAAYGFVSLVLIVFSLLSLVTFIKTRNLGYMIASLFQLSAGLWVGSMHDGIFHLNDTSTTIFSIGALFFMLWLYYLLFTRKCKWRGREILELAAEPVDETHNGFTPRPHPAGKIEYSKQELMEFTDFLRRNLIALPYIEKKQVVLVPVTMAQGMVHLFWRNRDLDNRTWVSFDFEGYVSVNIARKDYLNYNEALSFDQLCDSLGNLFIEFLKIHKKGEETRIIDRINAVKENPFT